MEYALGSDGNRSWPESMKRSKRCKQLDRASAIFAGVLAALSVENE
jgi:hypothetical protein